MRTAADQTHMLALSVRQPWAWAIVHANKNIENRVWRTNHRGPVLIHAAKGMTRVEYAAFNDFYRGEIAVRRPSELLIPVPPFDQLERGGFIGRAVIADCVSQHDSPWFCGPYGFVLKDAEPIPFHPHRGERRLFNVPASAGSGKLVVGVSDAGGLHGALVQ